MPIPVVTQPATPRTIAQGVAIPSLPISATNSPTSYAAAPLPAGISIDTETGVITGTPISAGLVSTSITATNGDGTSAPVTLVWNVQASPVGAGEWNDLELDFDLVTREVTIPGVTPRDDGRIFPVARGDKFALLVGFKKWGVLRDISPGEEVVAVKCALKEFEPEGLLELAGGLPTKVGSADTTRYRIPLRLSPQNWGVLADYEDDAGTRLLATSEIEVTVGAVPLLYLESDAETGFAIQGNVSTPIEKTLTYTGLPTTAGPIEYRLTLALVVAGRASQTITLTRDFSLSYDAPDWTISEIAGTDTGTGAADGTKWRATLENASLVGTATGITVVAEVTTSADTTFAYPYIDLSTGLSMASPYDSSSQVFVAGSLELWDGDTITMDEFSSTNIGTWNPTGTYDNAAAFAAALEAGWETASGASDVVSVTYIPNFGQPIFRVSLTGSAVTHIRGFDASPTTFEAVVTDIETGTPTTATVTGTIEQLQDPDDLPQRMTSLPFRVEVVRDQVPD
jgi:hypothetical protein